MGETSLEPAWLRLFWRAPWRAILRAEIALRSTLRIRRCFVALADEASPRGEDLLRPRGSRGRRSPAPCRRGRRVSSLASSTRPSASAVRPISPSASPSYMGLRAGKLRCRSAGFPQQRLGLGVTVRLDQVAGEDHLRSSTPHVGRRRLELGILHGEPEVGLGLVVPSGRRFKKSAMAPWLRDTIQV